MSARSTAPRLQPSKEGTRMIRVMEVGKLLRGQQLRSDLVATGVPPSKIPNSLGPIKDLTDLPQDMKMTIVRELLKGLELPLLELPVILADWEFNQISKMCLGRDDVLRILDSMFPEIVALVPEAQQIIPFNVFLKMVKIASYERLTTQPFNVATIEEIDTLKQLTLDQSKPFGYEGMMVFCTALSMGALASLEDLDIGRNNIGQEGMGVFCTALSTGALASLEKLDLGGNNIDNEGMGVFCTALSNGALASLKVLGLKNNDIGEKNGHAECTQVFSNALLRGALASLTKLFLYNNVICDEWMEGFSTALSSETLASLTILDLDNNNIKEKGMKAFSAAISRGALASLTELRVSDNQIGDEGIKAFSLALSNGSLASLKELYFVANNIHDEGMNAFALALSSGSLSNLKTVHVPSEHENHAGLVKACNYRNIRISCSMG